MKRLIPLALVALALSAVPAALADDGGSTPPATGQAPAAQQQAGAGDAQPRVRFRMILMRFARHCDVNATTDVQQRCAGFLQKLEDRIQAKCSAATDDRRCARLESLIQKLKDRLGGQAPAASDSSQSGLDNAAASLGGLKP